MGIKKIDVEKVAAAIEADAGEVLPDLRQALAEAKAGLGRVTTPDQILVRHGASQDSCHLIHAMKRGLFSGCKRSRMTTSRSGLSVTAPIGAQLRVFPDQRAGLHSRA